MVFFSNMTASKRKKVLIMITKSNWGGAQKHVFDIATSLPKDRFDVTVAFGGKGKLSERLASSHIQTVSIDSLVRDISILKEFKSLFAFFKLIQKEHPDIIHLHSPKAGLLGSFCARILGVPHIIYTAHGWSFNEDRGRLWKSLVYFCSWLTALFCHTVITVAEKETAQAQRFPGCRSKIVQIPLGINHISFKTRSDARAFIGSKIDTDISAKTVVGTNAELHKNKGLSYAVQAIPKLNERFPELIYIIISDGEERKHLEDLIRSHNLSQTVFLAGYIENAAEYLQAFDIFLLPSIKEGLPYVLLESGDASVPCIATNVGGIPSLITSMEHGVLIDPKSTEQITDAVALLLSDEDKRLSFAKNLKEKVNTQFTFSKMISSIIELYGR